MRTLLTLSLLSIAVLPAYTLNSIQFSQVFVQFGDNLGYIVPDQIRALLQSVPNTTVTLLEGNEAKQSEQCNHNHDPESRNLHLYFGNSTLSLQEIGNQQMNQLHAESTVISSRSCGCDTILACNGRPLDTGKHSNLSFDATAVHYGAVAASYKCLEMTGFLFYHPLDTFTPDRLSLSVDPSMQACSSMPPEHRPQLLVDTPHWPDRSFHIHTQHPLELTEVLQGHDIPQFGPHGPHCAQFTARNNHKTSSNNTKRTNVPPSQRSYCERWEDMVEDVNKLFQWAVANGLNKVEWLLLGNYKWGEDLNTKQRRLRLLTQLGHQYSIMVGADCPIGNIQQHAWHIVNVRLPFSEQEQQIRDRIDWIFNTGFDYITTESGLSEFTHPECGLMLDLMNAFASYANGTWGREAGIKVHCSTKQTCKDFLDPETGEPINFNFLPSFATPQMGVFPHTVQAYAFDDPTGGAYGNQNFSYMENYLVREAKAGQRSVSYYGETAYWVSVDVDVPLFLPIYGQRRLQDLRKIASREKKEGFRMDGQMNFDSGWEWGYWLNDMVTARASWSPLLDPDLDSDSCLGEVCLEREWVAFRKALQPIARIFGGLGDDFVEVMVQLTQSQADLLMWGKVKGKPSPNLHKLSGFPYLSGSDTWIDFPRLFGLPLLQPDKVHLDESSDSDWPHVLPLLAEMETQFRASTDALGELLTRATSGGGGEGERAINKQALLILEEIYDSVLVLALRAKQVRQLYQSRDPITHLLHGEGARIDLQMESRKTIEQAAVVVHRRESNYKVPWQRVGTWRENPTVYRYGYLWSAHSLYYWWRDQGLAEAGSLQAEFSPCYLNRMDASEVAVGWGKYTLELIRVLVNRYLPFTTGFPLEIVNCFAPPMKEYVFPRDLYSGK